MLDYEGHAQTKRSFSFPCVIHLSHNNSINPLITDMNQSVLDKAILRFTKNDSKNISRKNKCIDKKLTCKIAILMLMKF